MVMLELRSRYQKLVPHLQALYALYQSLVNARHQRGAIEFETIEPRNLFLMKWGELTTLSRLLVMKPLKLLKNV